MIVVMVVIVAIPVAIVVPTLLSSVPPLVEAVPACFALGNESVTALASFFAALAMLLDGLVEPGFGLLDAALALSAVIVGSRRQCREGHEEYHDGKCGQSR